MLSGRLKLSGSLKLRGKRFEHGFTRAAIVNGEHDALKAVGKFRLPQALREGGGNLLGRIAEHTAAPRAQHQILLRLVFGNG